MLKIISMRFPAPVSVQWIASLIDAEVHGNKEGQASGINEIHKVEPGDLVFVDHPKYYDKCINSAASFIIINKLADIPEGKALLVVSEPFEAYCKIVAHFRPFEKPTGMVSPTASIGEGTEIFPSAYIGNHVRIGKNCIIHPQVSILDHCIIGDEVIIQAATVIGGDAFYYNGKKNREVWYKKMPSCGRVLIENHVEIGAGCTIDRGVSHDTLIGQGTKIDNMVHIGHDSIIGKNCLIAAQVGIAGVVNIEDGVTLWGQVGVSKTLTIGENATIFAQSGVAKSIEGNQQYFGSPVEAAKTKMKELAWIKRIPEMWEKLNKRPL